MRDPSTPRRIIIVLLRIHVLGATLHMTWSLSRFQICRHAESVHQRIRRFGSCMTGRSRQTFHNVVTLRDAPASRIVFLLKIIVQARTRSVCSISGRLQAMSCAATSPRHGRSVREDPGSGSESNPSTSRRNHVVPSCAFVLDAPLRSGTRRGDPSTPRRIIIVLLRIHVLGATLRVTKFCHARNKPAQALVNEFSRRRGVFIASAVTPHLCLKPFTPCMMLGNGTFFPFSPKTHARDANRPCRETTTFVLFRPSCSHPCRWICDHATAGRNEGGSSAAHSPAHH